jgi:uncharacterized iron-regulated membrane protein
VSTGNQLSAWQRWVRQPQKTWLRRVLFQVHLWSGISLGLYILMISVTGSVLVYRNELYMAATPALIISKGSGPRLTDGELAEAAIRSYPGYRVARIVRARNPDQAVDIWLGRGGETKKRLFDPRDGSDVGSAAPTGIWLVSKLIALHDDLLGGPAGRRVNGMGALAVLVLAGSGLVIWWPGVKSWRRGLTLHRGVGWKRFTWDLHSMLGFWSLGFVLMIGLSGIYLCFPEEIQELADRLHPPTAANAGFRLVDSAIYWLAYLHFGRINGIGIPCSGPGICDQMTKAAWAVFGLAPSVMFVSGVILWWNRVLRPRRQRPSSSPTP